MGGVRVCCHLACFREGNGLCWGRGVGFGAKGLMGDRQVIDTTARIPARRTDEEEIRECDCRVECQIWRVGKWGSGVASRGWHIIC